MSWSSVLLLLAMLLPSGGCSRHFARSDITFGTGDYLVTARVTDESQSCSGAFGVSLWTKKMTCAQSWGSRSVKGVNCVAADGTSFALNVAADPQSEESIVWLGHGIEQLNSTNASCGTRMILNRIP
jgi:hypothetical protein